MEGGSGNDNTVRSFVSPDDAVDPDLPVTPRSTEVPIFQSKIKEKGKVTDSSHDPELEADTITGSKPSTALSGAGLCSDETEQDVDRDGVVREISVFCGSGNFGDDTRLYVVQHVLRGAWRPYELNKRCEEVRWKPKQQKMEVDLRMERGGHEHYDHERSKPLNLKKQTLSSTTVVSSHIQYAIGFLEKNKFHLNPVHAILQLRPSYASPLDLPKDEMVSETAEASSNPIKEQVASKHSDESKIDVEPWVVLQYHPIDSPLSNKIKQKMAAEVVRNAQFMMTRSVYLHSLPSRKLADETVTRAPSMRVLHRKPLEERLKQWFCERNQVNRFDALKHLAYGYSEDDLLMLLPSYANLVQGLWVCKSSLLYSGAEAIQRDYILFLFNKKDTIQYHKLREINLDPSVFQSMMGALAYDRKLLGDWKFKQSTDLSFIKSNPDIVKEHENAWLAHEKSILDSIRKTGKKFSMMMGSQASDSVETKTEHNADTSFNRDGDVIKSLAAQSMSVETHDHIRRALLEIFNYKTVLSFQSIVSGLQEIACMSSLRKDLKSRLLVNAATLALSAPVNDLRSVIDQVAAHVHGVYVLKTTGNPALDPLRNVVISLYQAREPNVKLRKKEIKQAAQLCLNIDISDYEYYQVMRELCIAKKFSWELKSGE